MGVLVLGGLVAIPSALILAQPYGYVKTEGDVEVEGAHDPTEAIVTAEDRAPTSGVVELTETEAAALATVDADTEVYAYVTTSGELGIQTAETPDEAIVHAEERTPHSGVMLVME